MSLNQANSYVRTVVREHTGRTPYGLKRSTVFFAGTMTLNDPGGEFINYGFRGLRAAESCIRRKSVKRCARNVRW